MEKDNILFIIIGLLLTAGIGVGIYFLCVKVIFKPKPDVPKPDVPKPDVPKPDVPKPDVPKPDVPKPDVPKPDVPKPDVPKPDVPKPDKPTEEAYIVKNIINQLNSSNKNKTAPLDTDEITINGVSLLLLPNIDTETSNIRIQSLYSNGQFSWNGAKKMYENVPKPIKKRKAPSLKQIVDILNYQITFELPVFNQIVIRGLVLKDLDTDIIPNIKNKDIQLAFDQGKIKYNKANNEFSI